MVGIGTDLIDPAVNVDRDWWIKKFNPAGAELWELMFDSGNGDEQPNDVAVSIEGGGIEYIYVVGSYEGAGAGVYPDWWIKKFNANGTEDTTNWNQVITLNSWDMANAVAVTSAYIYVTGNSSSDWYLAKFNKSSGARDSANWDKVVSSGGAGSPNAVSVGTDGSVYFCGSMYLTGDYYWAIKKYSSDGVEVTTTWPLSFGTAMTGDEVPTSMAITPANELYIAGYGFDLTGTGGNDWWIKKIASDGTEDTANWDKKIDSGNGSDVANGVAITPDGSAAYVVGYGSNLLGPTDADWWVKKFTPNGLEL